MTDPNQTRRLMSSETFIRSALGFIPQEQDSPFTLPSEQPLSEIDEMKLLLAVSAAERKQG